MAKKTQPSPFDGVAGTSADPRPAVDRAWEQVGTMTIGAAVAAIYAIPQVEYLEVAKHVPGRSSGVKVGELRAGEPEPEDAEQYVIRNWGAGTYNLSPIWRGYRLRTRSFVLGGVAGVTDGLAPGSAALETIADPLAQVDRILADRIKRKEARAVLRELEEIEKGDEEDDDVKAADLERIVEKIVQARPAAPPEGPTAMERILEKQMGFLEKQLELERSRNDRLMDAAAKPGADPNTLLGLSAAIIPLIGKLPGKSLAGLMNGVMRFLRPEESPPESGWTPEQVMSALQMAAPMVQQVLGPVLETVREALTGRRSAPVPNPADAARDVTPPRATTPPFVPTIPTPGAPAPTGGFQTMPLALTPEEKMSMDLFFQALEGQDYESAWTVLGTTPRTTQLNIGVLELKDTTPSRMLFPAFMSFDARAAGQRERVEAYLEWAKTVKKPEIEKLDVEGGEDDAGAD